MTDTTDDAIVKRDEVIAKVRETWPEVSAGYYPARGGFYEAPPVRDGGVTARLIDHAVDTTAQAFLEAMAPVLAEVERLTTANDSLARIAASVAQTLEQGKRDLMAHGWEKGWDDAEEWWISSATVPKPTNPFRSSLDHEDPEL